MEDAATAEIARTQLWQWLHRDALHLDDGTPVDFSLLECALLNLPARLGDRSRLPGGSRVSEAMGVLDRLTHAAEMQEVLQLPASDSVHFISLNAAGRGSARKSWSRRPGSEVDAELT